MLLRPRFRCGAVRRTQDCVTGAIDAIVAGHKRGMRLQEPRTARQAPSNGILAGFIGIDVCARGVAAEAGVPV